jgi:hypothetical protein
VSGLTVAAIVDQKVAGTLAQLNGRLEALVAEALDRELDKLIRERVLANLDARANDTESVVRVAARTTEAKTCNRCGQLQLHSPDAGHGRRAPTDRAARTPAGRRRAPRPARSSRHARPPPDRARLVLGTVAIGARLVLGSGPDRGYPRT